MSADGAEMGDPESQVEDERTLAAEIEILREENSRLRREYARARQSEYRRTAATLAALGVVAVLAGVLFPAARTVLFAFGGTGLFLAVLLYYLTPERFVSATVGEDVYATLARNETAIVEELGLADERVYVPIEGGVRLFVPQQAEYTLPAETHLETAFVVTDDPGERGITLVPTGETLLESSVEIAQDGRNGGPEPTVERLAESLVEQFEFVDGVDTDIAEGRATVGIMGSLYGRVDRIDHPTASVLAVGLARETDKPVTVTVETPDDGRMEWLVTCSWPAD